MTDTEQGAHPMDRITDSREATILKNVDFVRFA